MYGTLLSEPDKILTTLQSDPQLVRDNPLVFFHMAIFNLFFGLNKGKS